MFFSPYGSTIHALSTLYADQALRAGVFPEPNTANPVNRDNPDAAVVNLLGTKFRNNLEKHINDHYAGQGRLSKSMYGTLVDKSQNISSQLNINNPEDSLLYSGYLSAGFSYDKQARFVAGIEEITNTVNQINSTSA